MREDGRRVARGARAAEWLLAATTAPERAAAIIGDLSEQASGRSTVWFWQAALRIALACLRQSLFSPSAMETNMTRESTGFVGTVWRHKWLLLTCVVVSLATTSVVLSYVPARYRSQTLILVVPQRVPESYVPAATVASPLGDRLNLIQQHVLTRSRLERIVSEMNLYADARAHTIMEDVVERMRHDVTVQVIGPDSFKIGFDGDEPRAVQKVTERLTTLFISENLQERARLAEITWQFIEGQLQELRHQLDEREAALGKRARTGEPPSKADIIEYEVLQQEYRDLLVKGTAARMAADLENRQIGEQFRILDRPRLPTGPIAPHRIAANTGAAFAGLGVGGLLIAFRSRRRPRLDEEPSDEH